ncbi:hypothetical protein [Xanthomonas arboricola]|uniref:hypothetical protein n=1 Tax=Xanthomonas arboricola TaxID=56448 RepID=UPI0015E123BF|nr:hypothetical protein [Xanthomonas arboricola]
MAKLADGVLVAMLGRTGRKAISTTNSRAHVETACSTASGPYSAMTEHTPPPWKRGKPKGKSASTPLTASQKAAAKQRAEEAGRPYPNLVDNMWASRQPK